jgi:hypothetical protein
VSSGRRRRRTLIVVGGIALVALAASGGLALLRVRRDLQNARASLTAIVDDPSSLRTASGRVVARRQLNLALARVESARRAFDRSPGLFAAQVVPLVQGQRLALRALIHDAQSALKAGSAVIVGVDRVARQASVQAGVVPLETMATLQAQLSDGARASLAGVRSSKGLWLSLADARRKFDAVALKAGTRLQQAADAAAAARTFMGGDAPRRYLVAIENNAEMRDQGMVLSYAVIQFDHGHMSVERHRDIGDIELSSPVDVNVPPGTQQLFGDLRPTQIWGAVNATADFPWSASTMQTMLRATGVGGVDGVIALDVPALAAMLRVTGPIQVTGISSPITADDVGTVLLHDFYEGLLPVAKDRAPRLEKLADVAAAVIDRLTAGALDAVQLAQELGTSAAGGHLRLWSDHRAEEKVFETSGLGGGPASRLPDSTVHVALENMSRTKVDYYVRPKVVLDANAASNGDVRLTTTIEVPNGVPAGSKPSLALGPDPDGPGGLPGEYKGRVVVWFPRWSRVAGGVAESGLVAVERDVDVLPGTTATFRFEAVVPHAIRNGRLALRLVPQPRLAPADLDVRLQARAWRATGPMQYHQSWDRVLTYEWALRRVG